MTLEDEQSYLLGEKDHLLFTVQERKLTAGSAELREHLSKTCWAMCEVNEASAMPLRDAAACTALPGGREGILAWQTQPGQLPGQQNLPAAGIGS